MKFSVITPVYNNEKYIRNTIESVLRQTYSDVEYIVVDGGSQDNTLEIVEQYHDQISCIISEPDSGMYNAINKGFKRSSGDVMSYLCSDDLLISTAIETVAEFFSVKKVKFCFGNCIYIDSLDNELYRVDGVDMSFDNVLRLGRIPFAQPTVFWHRNLYERIGGFDESYRYSADAKFFFNCFLYSNAAKIHVNEYLAMFRKHQDALSSKGNTDMKMENKKVREELNINTDYSAYLIELFIKWKNKKNILRQVFGSSAEV